MREVALGAIALVAGLASLGCVVSVDNGRVQSPDLGTDPVGAGRQAYVARCAACHGIEARGDGPVGAALRTVPPDLTWLSERNGGTFPRAYVIDVVTGAAAVTAHGTRDMPIWSDRLGPSDGSGATVAGAIYLRRTLDALVAYLESIQRRLSAARATTGPVVLVRPAAARGRAILDGCAWQGN